jgi:hypothetical protein
MSPPQSLTVSAIGTKQIPKVVSTGGVMRGELVIAHAVVSACICFVVWLIIQAGG